VFFTKTDTANLDPTDASARARAARKAAKAAAQNAATAARAAAAAAQIAAQNAAQKSQIAAQNAAQKSTAVAQNAAQKSTAVAQNAAQKSTAVAQNAGGSAQTTAAGVSKQVQQGVYSARRWAAPKLESVADYATTTVAPTVSSALRNTANQVRPADPVSPAKRRMASALTWSLLGAAVLAAAGAAAALVRYRRRAAVELDTETPDSELGETPTGVSGKPADRTPTMPTTPEPVVQAAKTSSNASANKTKTTTDASVNGHASTSGW